MSEFKTLPEQIEALTTELATAKATIAASPNAAAIEASSAERDALRNENAGLRARVAELEAASGNEEISAQLAEARAQIESMKSAYADAIAKIEASVTARANRIAIEKIASVGHTLPEDDPEANISGAVRADLSSYREEYGEPTPKPAASALDRAVAGMGAMFKRQDKN